MDSGGFFSVALSVGSLHLDVIQRRAPGGRINLLGSPNLPAVRTFLILHKNSGCDRHRNRDRFHYNRFAAIWLISHNPI